MVQMNLFEGRNRDADSEKGLVDTGWEGEGGNNWESSIDIYTPCACVAWLCSAQFFETSWTAAHQAPLSMGFSRQEHCSRLAFPLAGDFPDPGWNPALNPVFPALQILYHWATYGILINTLPCFSGGADDKEPTWQCRRPWSLGQEDPPEKGLATHSSILAWKIPWTEEPGRLQPIESQKVRHNWSDLE